MVSGIMATDKKKKTYLINSLREIESLLLTRPQHAYKMSRKGKSYLACSTVHQQLQFYCRRDSAGISFTPQLMTQTEPLVRETWQGHFDSLSLPFPSPIFLLQMRNCPLGLHVYSADPIMTECSTASVTLSMKCHLCSPLFF